MTGGGEYTVGKHKVICIKEEDFAIEPDRRLEVTKAALIKCIWDYA